MKTLWITSFDKAMYEASGAELMGSFHRTSSEGNMLVCYEGMPDPPEASQNDPDQEWLLYYNLSKDDFLKKWLLDNQPYIPRHLGGTHPGCQCRRGPFPVHDKRHKMPCVGHWFNRNASRWFRKIACLKHALEWRQEGKQPWDVLIWIDADCVFKQRVTGNVVDSWFERGSAVFYHQAQRPVLEAGIMGYWLDRGADRFLEILIRCYQNGSYRKLPRWDDSYVIQHTLKVPELQQLARIDLASHTGKEHADVVPYGPVGHYIEHRKGRHSRELGIMT